MEKKQAIPVPEGALESLASFLGVGEGEAMAYLKELDARHAPIVPLLALATSQKTIPDFVRDTLAETGSQKHWVLALRSNSLVLLAALIRRAEKVARVEAGPSPDEEKIAQLEAALQTDLPSPVKEAIVNQIAMLKQNLAKARSTSLPSSLVQRDLDTVRTFVFRALAEKLAPVDSSLAAGLIAAIPDLVREPKDVGEDRDAARKVTSAQNKSIIALVNPMKACAMPAAPKTAEEPKTSPKSPKSAPKTPKISGKQKK